MSTGGCFDGIAKKLHLHPAVRWLRCSIAGHFGQIQLGDAAHDTDCACS